MASIQAYGSKNHYHLFKLTLTEKSTSLEGNTSTVNFVFNLSERSGYSFPWDSWGSKISYTITINGTKYTGTIPNYTPSTSGTNIKTGNIVISHNSDGTKEINYSFSVTDSTGATYTCGNASASGKMTLTTLPRATTPTLSSTSIELGESITIYTPRASENFTHELSYAVEGKSAKTVIASDVIDSYTWEDTLFLANFIDTSPSGSVTIYCKTYNGDERVGEKTVTFTGNVPSSVVPEIETFTIEEYVSDVATKVGKYLKEKSQLSINASAKGRYGSTIISYRISANDEIFTSASAITSVLKNSGVQTISVTVTDSRGRSSTKGKTINVVDYYSPKASGLWVERCDSNGTLKDDGVYVKTYINYDIAPIENLNTKKASIQYLNGETWTTLTTFTDTYSASSREHVITNTEFNVDNTYQFKLVVEDYFSSDDWTTTLPTSYTLMNYHASGKAIGFGKVATREKGFQFGDFIYDQWDTVITNGLAVYGGDPDTTLESLIMTSTNSPTGFAMYFHTFFASNKTAGQNRGQIAIPYLGSGSMYYRWRFNGEWTDWYEIAAKKDLDNISKKIEDTDWIDAELESDFRLYNSSSYCRYRKIGKVVNIQFVLSPSSNDNVLNSATETTAFVLPEEFRPSQNLNFISQGSGTNIFTVGVNTSGNVNIYRYRNSSSYSSTPPNTSAWLPANITYFVD